MEQGIIQKVLGSGRESSGGNILETVLLGGSLIAQELPLEYAQLLCVNFGGTWQINSLTNSLCDSGRRKKWEKGENYK